MLQLHKTLHIIFGLFIAASLMAQAPGDGGSTEDLSFLIGEWEVSRTYSPSTDNERILKGTLVCKAALDDQFINCRYEMERPGKVRGLDEVFFNYNPIYEVYESLWLSSTWPIKVLMQGTLGQEDEKVILSTSASFLIENNVMEYVKGELTLDGGSDSFIRKTLIRTSEYEEGEWLHHMTETAKRVTR